MKRVSKLLRVIPHLAVHTSGMVRRVRPPMTVLHRYVSTVDEKTQAHEDLKNAVRELSEGDAVPISYAPVSTLLAWDKQKLANLTTEQLEELGRAWFEGVEDELEPNHLRAFEIWTEATQRGSTEAKYSRAVCLRQGLGVQRDDAAAFRDMKELADSRNYGLAHYAVAIMLTAGEGAPQDLEKAFYHLNQAGLGGVTPALHNMGNAYANGHGVPKDEARAAKFYEGGAQAGDPASKFTLGTWLYRGRGGLAVDKKRSFQLQLEAAEAGHPGAMFNTGTAYMEGEAEPQDFHKAAEWFEKAADKGVAEANVNLGSMYRAGLGVPKDLHKARSIFQRFAAQHEVSAELVKEVEQEIAAESKKLA